MLYDDSIGFSFLDILWASHFVSLKVRPESFDQASSRFRSDWRETQHQQQTWDFVDLCVRLANIIVEVNFNRWGSERRNEFFTEWLHVTWLAEWNNIIIYSECNIWKMAQRNKLNRKHARISVAPFAPVHTAGSNQQNKSACCRSLSPVTLYTEKGTLVECEVGPGIFTTVNESYHICD